MSQGGSKITKKICLRTEDTKGKKIQEWAIRKPVPQQQDTLSCKIAVEYFPGEKVKN